MRNLVIGAALAAGTTLGALAPALADDANNQGAQAPSVDPTQTSSVGSSVSGEWLKLCISPLNSVMCQGHATYKGIGGGLPGSPGGGGGRGQGEVSTE